VARIEEVGLEGVELSLGGGQAAEPIVIKEFLPKEGASEGAEKVLSTCTESCRICPCFVHRVNAKPPLTDGTLVHLL
jgi:hypothetical protein